MKKHEGRAICCRPAKRFEDLFEASGKAHKHVLRQYFSRGENEKHTPVAEIRLKHKTNQIAFNETVIVSNLVSFLFLSHQPFVVRRSKTKREHTRIRRNTHFFRCINYTQQPSFVVFSPRNNPHFIIFFLFCSFVRYLQG